MSAATGAQLPSRGTAASAAVSVVSLAAVVWWVSNEQAPRLPTSAASLMTLALALALYAAATCARGERWHRLLRATEVRPRRLDSYRLTTIGYMGNNVLPARAGEAMRVFLLGRRTHGSKRAIAGTIVAERVLDAAALAVVLALTASTTLAALGPIGLPGAAAVAGGLAVALAAGFGAREVARRTARGRRALSAAMPLLASTRSLLSRRGAALFALSLAIWLLEGSVYLLVASAVGLGIDAPGALAVMALANFVSLLPSAPGYLGTFDAAVLAAVRALGGVTAARLPYLLLLRFVLFVPITLAGMVMLVTGYGGWARVRGRLATATR